MARSDEEQIRELIGAYAERLDAGDLDGVAALFEHGVFRSARGGEPLVGRDAVRRQYDPVILYPDDRYPNDRYPNDRSPDDRYPNDGRTGDRRTGDRHATPRTMHVLGNIEVVIDRPGPTATATARCTFTVLQAASPGELGAVLSGRYHDRFELVDGSWRFVERVVHPDLLGDLSRHMGRPA